MPFGLSSYAYRRSIGAKGFSPSRPMTAEQLIGKAIQHRLTGVQICDHVRFVDLPDASLFSIRNIAENNGLFIETGASKSDPDYLRKLINVSEKLGAKILRVIPEIEPKTSKSDRASELAHCIDQISKVTGDAKKADVKLALENHAQITSEELVQLICGIDDEYVGACLDTMNSVVLLEHPIATAELLAPYAISAHFKDFKIVFDPHGHRIIGVPMGDGMINFKKILKLVSENSLDPNILIELFVDQKENEQETLEWEMFCVDKSVKYAMEVLKI